MPPNGVVVIPLVPPEQVAETTEKEASTPATICIAGNIPHLGLIVKGFSGQVSLLLEVVQAKNKLVILSV